MKTINLKTSAIELSTRLHSREITAVDLLQATLNRIDDVNPKIKAIVALRKDRDKLLEEALAADIDLDSAAASADKEIGWLRGIPLAIKDLANAEGLPTTRGCPLFGEQTLGEDDDGCKFEVETEDDPFVKRLKDAGAIIIGKTNTPELGLGCHSYNSIHGTTRNPYNLSVAAGGSSGGAAAAIASQMLSIADGSDMMGSLRNPAGWNNLYSLRPTSEWMQEVDDDEAVDSTEAGFELPYPLSTVGPIARCPEDLAMFLETILPEERQADFDASSVIDQSMEDLNSLVKRSQIGWLGDWGGSLPFEDGVLSQCKRSLDLFESIGDVSIECLPAPFPNDTLWGAWMAIRSHSILNSLQETIVCGVDNDVIATLKKRGVKPEAIWECEQGKSLTRRELERAIDTVHNWSVCVDKIFQSFDFLALPSSQVYPFDASLDWPRSIAGKKMNTYHRWMEVMVPVTLLGLPCVTIPAGAGLAGLPTGIQIFASKGQDAKLLKLARWYCKNVDLACPDLAV